MKSFYLFRITNVWALDAPIQIVFIFVFSRFTICSCQCSLPPHSLSKSAKTPKYIICEIACQDVFSNI